MRSRTANWYETTVRYEKTMEDGMQKKISELYVVDAVSFGDAEKSIASEMSAYVSGELEIKNINPAAYGEIFFSENGNDDRWYKAKLQFITLDEKSGKEKRSNVNYLVQAANMNGAIKNIDTVMGGTMIDYVIANISRNATTSPNTRRRNNGGRGKKPAGHQGPVARRSGADGCQQVPPRRVYHRCLQCGAAHIWRKP